MAAFGDSLDWNNGLLFFNCCCMKFLWIFYFLEECGLFMIIVFPLWPMAGILHVMCTLSILRWVFWSVWGSPGISFLLPESILKVNVNSLNSFKLLFWVGYWIFPHAYFRLWIGFRYWRFLNWKIVINWYSDGNKELIDPLPPRIYYVL